MRTILHSDLNNFYATVEELYNPAYKKLCMAVTGSLSARHGIVLAKNINAKKLGIKTGMTVKQAFDLCPSLVLIEAHFDRYLDYSKKVKKIYSEFTDRVESFGIDEAWLDVTNSKIFGTGEQIADKIRERVRELGLTASVGVSFNKIFAKLGSDMKKPDATTVISYENFKQKLWGLNACDLLFVGRATAAKLKKFNIVTIGDIALQNIDFLRKTLGKWGEYLYIFANGLDTSLVKKEIESDPIKSIGNSMTCYRDLKSEEDIKIMFSVLAESVSARLVDSDVGMATGVSITVRDSELEFHTRQQKLDKPSVLADDFFNAAIKIFAANFSFSQSWRSLGISVYGFCREEQLSIFSNTEKYEKKVGLLKTVEKIRSKYGEGGVQKAITLKDKRIAKENPKGHVIHPEGFL